MKNQDKNVKVIDKEKKMNDSDKIMMGNNNTTNNMTKNNGLDLKSRENITKTNKENKKNHKKRDNKKRTVVNKDSDRIDKNKDFVRTEGFNALRTNVRICLKKNTKNKILITSSVAGEGKSTCSVNLAISFANTGKSVLMIDCDMRRPVIHKTFGLNNRKGLSDILSNLSNVSDCIQKTNYDNLSVISAGVKVPNPSELLSSQEIKDLVNDLENKYDYIIFDCPPINVVADAVPLFEIVDGIVLVARYNKTNYFDLQKSLFTIEFAKANLFGVFFYDMPMNGNKKYGYKKYGYRYYNKYGYYNHYGESE